MSRKNILIAAAAIALLALGGLGYYLFQGRQGGDTATPEAADTATAGAPVQAPGKLPDPVFLVMDKQGVVQFSLAGKDIARQLQPIVKQIDASIRARREALDREADQLEQDTTLAPAEREKRIAALSARQRALQEEAQKRQQQLQAAMASANAELGKAMAGIVPAIVKERGANIVLDRAALPQVDPAFDITPEVIKRLDAQLTSVKIPLDGLK